MVTSKKIPKLRLIAFLWFFLSTDEIRGNRGEGNSLTPQHLSILDITLRDHRPILEPPGPWAQREKELCQGHTLSLWQNWDKELNLPTPSQRSVPHTQRLKLCPNWRQGFSSWEALRWANAKTLRLGFQGSDVCKGLIRTIRCAPHTE